MVDVQFIDANTFAIAVPKLIPATRITSIHLLSITYMIYRENSEDNYNYIYVSIVKYIFIYVIIETSRKGTVVRSGLFSSPWNEIRQSCRASCFIQEYYPVNVLKAGLHSPFSCISWPGSIFFSSNPIITLLCIIEIILHYCIYK